MRARKDFAASPYLKGPKELFLENNDITDEGLAALRGTPAVQQGAVTLHLDGNPGCESA